MEYRPLEGFVFAVTPFNFTAIGGNLPTSPALMGNTVVWKPASTAAYSAHFLMRLLQEAGLPDGVINLVYGSGAEIGDAALASEHLAGVHFTGSTGVFQSMWKTIGANIAELPQLPAHRRRDRRQGLHPRARVGGRRRASRRRSSAARSSTRDRSARPRHGSSSPTTSGPSCASGSQPRSTRCRSATCATSGTSWAPSSTATRSRRRRRRSTRRRRRRRSSPAARTTTREGWFVRPTVVETDDPDFRLHEGGAVRPRRDRVRLPAQEVRRDARARSTTARRTVSPAPSSRATAARSSTRARSSATRPATSTSTTSRQAPSSASSRSAARARPARTTRRARCGT